MAIVKEMTGRNRAAQLEIVKQMSRQLRRALMEYKGAVLLVSHEPEFYEDWVDDVWNIEKWTTKVI